MSRTPTSPVVRFSAAAAAVGSAVGGDDVTASVRLLDDNLLLAVLTDASEARHALDVILATLSAEAARRSARELGYDGLAQRSGHRNATSLVQQITGQSRGDVTRTLRIGEELAAPDVSSSDPPTLVPPSSPPWMEHLKGALADGRIGPSHYEAIRTGLGDPPLHRYPELDPEFLPEAWANAVVILIEEARRLPVEELRGAARMARDRMDPTGVTLRFEERFEARSFRLWIDEHGQHHGRMTFDDEAAAWAQSILRAAMRPRRGPRFVSDGSSPDAAIPADERTNEQLQYDTLIAVLRTGAAADPTQAFGDRQPGVRIIVEAAAITGAAGRGGQRVTGIGHLEDGGQALPGGVIEKFLCDAGSVPIVQDEHGRPLDVGRERRLFTRKQRIAIAARDGGCIWPSCIAPPSECEYHHIDHWWADHGRTDVDDGVPLCRNCHLRLHNSGWRIARERDPVTGADAYLLHAPPDSATGTVPEPVALSSKAPRRFAAA